MSDVFHKDVPDDFIDLIFAEMERNPKHVFQVLTKRAERLRRYINRRYRSARCPSHIWIGVSVESLDYQWRAQMLRESNAFVRWISAEPLLEPLDTIDLSNIDWVVVGGESGPGARVLNIEWIRVLRDRCRKAGIAFFFKQWGRVSKKHGGEEAVLDGRRWLQYPKRAAA